MTTDLFKVGQTVYYLSEGNIYSFKITAVHRGFNNMPFYLESGDTSYLALYEEGHLRDIFFSEDEAKLFHSVIEV